MRLAMRLPEKRDNSGRTDADPREELSAEVIDLASRNAFPAITQRKKGSDALGLAAGVAVVALLGAVTLWGLDSSRTETPAGAQPQGAADVPPPVPAEAITDLVAPPPATGLAPLPDPAPAPVLARDPGLGVQPGLQVNPYATPTVVYDSSPVVQVAAPAPAGETTAPAASGAAGDFASRIGGVGGGPARAVSQFDPQTTVTQGTLIPAVLETAIDTDVPGFVRAVVSQDVRSYDGSRILVPRSSRLIGQYQSGLQAGQKRAYVIWTRLIRPDGISVDIASPATDFSGMAGLPGKVDNHFFKRFGSAMLLSVIGGLTTVASGGTSLLIGGGESAASAAVAQDGKIGPTVRVRVGAPIRVFTARDLDFSRAPEL
jgi:type IV secretion system protein VirB10